MVQHLKGQFYLAGSLEILLKWKHVFFKFVTSTGHKLSYEMVNILVYHCYFHSYLKDFMSMTANSIRGILSKNHEAKYFFI